MRFFGEYELGIRGAWKVKRVENGGKSCCFLLFLEKNVKNFYFFIDV